MGKITKIDYVDATWNPWFGCTPVSEGCRNCYARRYWKCLGVSFCEVRRAADATFNAPLKWKEPRRIMVCSLSDFFIEEADAWRYEAIDIMESCFTQQHTFIIPTKRTDRIIECLGNFYEKNIWILASVENQEMADKRIPELLKLKEYGDWEIGLSVEPLLSAIDLKSWIKNLSWIIAGGESGVKAHPCHPDWVRSLRDQCVEAGVPFFFKQWGEWAPALELYREFKPIKTNKDAHNRVKIWEDKEVSFKVGKKTAGCMLDGREWKEYPK